MGRLSSGVSRVDEYEIAKSGELYRSEVLRLYRFLVDGFGFEAPLARDGNYSYSLTYEHIVGGMEVILSNAYHSVDYGFEITFDRKGPWRGDERNVVFFTLKEDQDSECRFLSVGAEALRKVVLDWETAHKSIKPKPLRGSA